MKIFLKTLTLSALSLFIGLTMVFAQAPQPQVTYFLGEVKNMSPTGQSYGTSVSLVKRTINPVENKIIELVASIDPKEPTKEYTTVFDIKGSKFTLKDDEGTFAGDGDLIGNAWEWRRWKYTVNMLGERKGKLKGEDTLNNGVLEVKKSFSTPDGQVRVVINEELKQISKEMYELLHTKLLLK